MTSKVLRVLGLAFIAVSTASAEVVRIEIDSRVDVAGGMSYGLAGSYERIVGTVYFAVDPDNLANRIITDINFAPRNADGKVEFHSNFFMLKPKDVTHGNGTVFYEVSNRGRKGILGYYNNAVGSLDPQTADEMGDGFLMRNGFTLLWLGWQFDPPMRDGLMRVHPPTATHNGASITGLVRSEIIVSDRAYDWSLADRSHVAYAVLNPDDSSNVMTVRAGVDQPRRVVPQDQWRFARRDEIGRIVVDPTRVYLEGGFEPGKIYDVVYTAQDPPVSGLGLAAVRDMISQLKYYSSPELSITRNDINHTIAWGSSQSGRFLRTFMYDGFNEDEASRKAFDGVMAHIAGGGRGSFNVRFAQPSRDGHPFLNKLYPTDIFPFTDVVQSDPATDMRDGLLAGVRPAHMPKVFYTNSSYEYWGRTASLIHTTIDGSDDAQLMDNVRVYSFAGGQHGPGRFPPRQTIGQQLSNPNDYSWFLRSLLLGMNRWVKDGTPPPDSRHPTVSDNELVSFKSFNFPSLPRVGQPAEPHKAYRIVYGLEFRSGGVATVEPPEVLSEFPILVPTVDADGNETAGLMMPEVAVPLATYTGWNLFRAESGPTNVLSSMQGSMSRSHAPRLTDVGATTHDCRSKSATEAAGSTSDSSRRLHSGWSTPAISWQRIWPLSSPRQVDTGII